MKIQIQQIILGLLPAGYFIWTADFTGAVLVLFILCVLDLITGIRKSQYLKCFCSRVAKEKSVKKAIEYLILLVAGYTVNMFLLSLEPTGYIATFLVSLMGELMDYLFIFIVAFLIAIEFYSILENLSTMGMPLPRRLMDKWSKNVEDITCSNKDKKDEAIINKDN